MRSFIKPFGAVGFVLSAWFAVVQQWSLPEFSWSIWLGGLLYAWACIFAAAIQIMLSAGSLRAVCEMRLPLLQRVPQPVFFLGVAVVVGCAGTLSFRLSCFLFGFYGLFLSVFAEMEPRTLFGRNGFINSDFFTPVMYLVEWFWPVAVGIIIANWRDFVRPQPWKRVLLPVEREILRLHVFVLALPFFSMLAWFLLGEAYQTGAIVLLMGLLYLMPNKQPKGGQGKMPRHILLSKNRVVVYK